MCFERACELGFIASARAPNDASTVRSHMASLMAWARATYSASHVDSTTLSCFFDAQLTAPPLSIET